MKKLKDKVTVISGGLTTVGLATARRFLKEGARVFIWDQPEPEPSYSHQHLQILPVETTSPESVNRALKQVLNNYSRIDVLINATVIARDAHVAKMTMADWQQVLDTNLTGVFNCIRAVIPTMMQQQEGCIINTSSTVGNHKPEAPANYAAAMNGLTGMSRSLAKELGPNGITVNVVAPGFIATEEVQRMPEKVVELIIQETPLARLGTPEEVASAYAFLASAEARFISGAVLAVDGAVSG